MKPEQKIATYCEAHHIWGVLRVTWKGKVVHEQKMGFADYKHGMPFTENSMFTLYSLSKPFCAIGLMKLRDMGLVDLDAHPGRYIPEAAGFDSRVTVRQLLHHTSGLPDFEQIEEFAKKHAPGYRKYIREHLELLSAYPQYFAPGTGSKYANVNFVLCALIIENISGMAYADYMKTEIFEPLGMKTAVVDREGLPIPNRVKGYALEDGAPVEIEKSYNWILGAADIVGTVEDVYCLNKAIKDRLLLSEESWQMILTPSNVNDKGMGCTVSCWHGKQRITHNGGHLGFRTLHIQLPQEDFDIIFLSNSGFGNARNDLAEIVYETFYTEVSSKEQMIEMDVGYI